MIKVQSPVDKAPESFTGPLQAKVYAALDGLGIDFLRVECEPAITIADCEAVAQALGVPVVKTLFLANRQLTRFHLLVMPGDKPFVTKDFSRALSVSRVSFVPAELLMEMLQTPVGAASPLSVIADANNRVQLAVDADVLSMPEIACPDTTTTNYLRLKTADIFQRFIPSTGHSCDIITL